MQSFAIYGAAQRPQEPTPLRAGPVSLLFDRGGIRYLRLGDTEILRRIYVAVRDRSWRTIEGELSDLAALVGEDSFSIAFRMLHQSGDIRFAWAGRIEGLSTGRVRFEMQGTAQRDFLTNRTGFCILHPLALCAGKPCAIEHSDGSRTRGSFPADISPHQPFRNIRAITHRANEAEVRVLMEGDVFEMEDQRNWSDASFKTYCRPLELPSPYELKAGTAVRQSVTVEVSGTLPPAATGLVTRQQLDLSSVTGGEWVAQVGLGVADDFERLNQKSIAALMGLRPRHLRLDVDLASPDWRPRLEAQAAGLARTGIPLELALYMTDDSRPAAEFAELWPTLGIEVLRWLVLPQRGVSNAQQMKIARSTFCPKAPKALIGGGTEAEFVAINRTHPPEHLDFVSFSLNPQVHATDDLSLMENLEAQGDVVASAVKLSADAPISVSPVALRRKSRHGARAPDSAAAAQELPPDVDPRQMSLLAAAWTLGSLSRLCHADFLTFYETHGWRGVLQGPEPSQRPAAFPAAAGDIFPVYHVLKSLLTFNPEHWLRLNVKRPLELAAMLLRKPGRDRLLLANLTNRPSEVELNLPAMGTVTLLDPSNVESALHDPEFWVNAPSASISERATVDLREYAIAQVDWSLPDLTGTPLTRASRSRPADASLS